MGELPDDIAPRQRGAAARPVRWGGVDYPSSNAAMRGHLGLAGIPGGDSQRVLRRAIASGDAEYLPSPSETASGARGAARRILRAAQEIREQAAQLGGEGTGADGRRVSIGRRRMGLLRALRQYRERFGHGITEALDGEG